MPLAPLLAERLAGLIDFLCRAVAARSAGGALAGPLIILIWSQLRRRAGRILRLAARLAAGTPPAPPRASVARPARPRPHRLPRGFAWLVRLVPEAATGAARLQHLLTQPEMAELIADARMRRLLRPLCQMLGVAPPSPPPPPPPSPPPPPAKPPPLARAAPPRRAARRAAKIAPAPPPRARPAGRGPPVAA